ncbi:DUF2785 domain-containing protein [Candidatus Izemoplasma sp. B36]|uniref:DUF2785 domain-containing protein n=1 Tax=Candidatus Izemoplasma sp. B36 TaxID=3242468 RepID=UPI003557F7ED
MLKKQTLEVLKKQKEEKFAFIDINKLELLNELIDNIGVEDSETRDGLIYPNLAHLLHDKHFDEDTLSTVLETLLDDKHLFYDIEDNIKNSVLTRSFTSLQLVILVYVHKRDNIISKDLIYKTFTTFLDYFDKEKHYEGYNDEVGWLHSIAHSADVFAQFLTIDYFKSNEIEKVFESVMKKFKTKEYYFSHNEDERLIVGIKKAIQRDILEEAYIIDYIERFSDFEKTQDYPEMFYIKNNIKNFLGTLYFSLIEEEKYENITNKIKEVMINKVKLR